MHSHQLVTMQNCKLIEIFVVVAKHLYIVFSLFEHNQNIQFNNLSIDRMQMEIELRMSIASTWAIRFHISIQKKITFIVLLYDIYMASWDERTQWNCRKEKGWICQTVLLYISIFTSVYSACKSNQMCRYSAFHTNKCWFKEQEVEMKRENCSSQTMSGTT